MSDKQGAPILPPLSRGASNNGGSNGGASQQTVSLQQVLASAQGLNVLATGGGQQFVITTQVSGITQVPFSVFIYLLNWKSSIYLFFLFFESFKM